MGKNRHLRKIRAGLVRKIDAHEEKIRQERLKPFPNQDSIDHWEGEMRPWKERVRRIDQRLP